MIQNQRLRVDKKMHRLMYSNGWIKHPHFFMQTLVLNYGFLRSPKLFGILWFLRWTCNHLLAVLFQKSWPQMDASHTLLIQSSPRISVEKCSKIAKRYQLIRYHLRFRETWDGGKTNRECNTEWTKDIQQVVPTRQKTSGDESISSLSK